MIIDNGSGLCKAPELPLRVHQGLNIITYTILVAPDYNYSITGPKTLFYFLRPLWFP